MFTKTLFHIILLVDPYDPSELIDGIRRLYKTREGRLPPFPWCEEFHFQLDDIYTRLKVISRKKTRGTATDEIVNMSAIFKPDEEWSNPRTVLIEGKPGMGKTTYCKKLVYDWATGKPVADDCFPKFETVLSLKCRDIKSGIWEAIDDQLLPLDIKEDIREKFFTFIRNNQSSVLLVLDGLDELPAGKLPEFSEIIQGRVLPKCHLVATSRHEAGMKVRRYCDTILEIEGFTEEDATKFIYKYFKNMEDLAQKLLFKVKKDKSLKDLTANPLNTVLLCLFCEECQGIFPESSTQLYLDIMECVLRRFRRKKGLPETNEKLTEVYKTELKLLGRIALNGLCEGNLDFDERELRNHNVELSGFGFLSVQPGGSKMGPCRYAFLHKSFQEVFAAYYLCCQLVSQEISPESFVSDESYFNELKQVLVFSCGILAVQSEETAVDLMANITTQVNKFGHKTVPVALDCIAESKKEQSNVHVKLARVFGSGLDLAEAMKINTTPTELIQWHNNFGDAGAASLAEVMKVNRTLTQLRMTASNTGDAGAASLAEAMKVNTTLTQLALWSNNTGDAGAASLAEAMKVNTTLTQLDLSINSIGAAGAASLAEAMKVNTTLTQLRLSSNNIGDVGATSLAEAMKVNTTLTKLLLTETNIGAAGAASLAEAMKVNTTLTQLALWSNNTGDAGAASLAEAMKVNTTLTQLDLSINSIGAAGAASLAEAMKVNTTLTQLRLFSNNIGDVGATSLAEAMKVNTTLTKLLLTETNIGAAGAASLAEAMKVNTTLTQLGLSSNNIGSATAATLLRSFLWRNNIGDAGAASLFKAVKVNTALKELHLSNSDIGVADAASLAEAMKVNTTLTQLDLSENTIGDAGAASLAEAMKVNTTLTQLDLSGNTIDDAGAASLAEAMKVNTTLAQLNLMDDYFGDAGAASLAEAMKVNTTLTELDLSHNCSGDAGAASLAEAMKVNTTLTKLYLPDNNISDAGAASLAEAIKVNTTLTQLDLTCNNIGYAGAASLAEAREVNKTLKDLNLGLVNGGEWL